MGVVIAAQQEKILNQGTKSMNSVGQATFKYVQSHSSIRQCNVVENVTVFSSS